MTEAMGADLRWVLGDRQFADGLTKFNKILRAKFLEWLKLPFAQLHGQNANRRVRRHFVFPR